METLSSWSRPRGWIAIETTGAGTVRRCVRSLAIDGRLPDAIRDRAILAATELATNLERHATGGELFIAIASGGYDLLSIDRGPGIPDLERALAAGYSTAGGLGEGLGTLQRQSDALEIRTDEAGTLIRVRVGPTVEEDRAWAVVERAYPRGYETGWSCASGDGWRLLEDDDSYFIVLVDALGHGGKAAAASRLALEAGGFPGTPEDMLRGAATALGTGRGAVGAAVRIDRSSRMIEASIVGNIAVRVEGPSHPHRVAARDGILGPRLPTLRTETFPLPRGHTLLIHSDGISARRRLQVPGSVTPLMHAALLYRVGARFTDDACVLAFRFPEDGG